jgi:excisionase family DNA binding protein
MFRQLESRRQRLPEEWYSLMLESTEGGVEVVNHERLLLTVEEAGDLLGCGRTLVYGLMRTGEIPSVLVGRLRRIRRGDLERFAARLPSVPVQRSSGNSAA